MFTETEMNGTLTAPNTASAAANLSDPGPAYFRTKRYDSAISHPTNDIVSRGSQSHQIPQAFLAQSGPVTITMRPNSAVSSAAAIATRSARRSLRHKYRALATPQTIADSSITMPDGAWKYRIFETIPIDAS